MNEQLLPRSAVVRDRVQESPTICTLRLAFDEAASGEAFVFVPGQFNMVYLDRVGEVAMSIVSDPLDTHGFDHIVRRVGRVTEGLDRLRGGVLPAFFPAVIPVFFLYHTCNPRRIAGSILFCHVRVSVDNLRFRI